MTYQAKLEERHKKGRIEGKEEMVVNMIRDGYLMSAITKLSQFTEDHVRRLAEENNLTIAIG